MAAVDAIDPTDFPIENLPYGVFTKRGSSEKRLGTAFGDNVVDITGLAKDAWFAPLGVKVEGILKSTVVWNNFAALGRDIHREYRRLLTQILIVKGDIISSYVYSMNEVELQMPIQVGDYTDFWCSEHHALNGSKINRNMSVLPEPWYRLPGGYMGRASSIGIDQDIHRPLGQSQLQNGDPHVGPCQKFDFEVEFAWVIGKENKRGARIPLEQAEDHLFGAVLMNDWSARDFAAYEVQTGGVTTCKNFATTISPWIVSIEALAPFKATLPLQQPEPVPHLSGPGSRSTYDVHIKAYVGKPSSNPAIAATAAVQTTETNLKHIYWTPAQMVAYFTISGANFRSGDIFGTGTVSGPDEKSLGCLLEKSWGGTREWEGPSGEKRTWLEDGDKVVISAYCEAGNLRIGFGKSSGTVLPSLT